jgi:hypothetical protein
MAITATNNKPAVLSPVYSAKLTGNYDPTEFIKETIVDPLYAPLVANTQVSIQANGKKVTQNDIIDMILNACGDTINLTAEDALKELYHSTLVYYDKAKQMGVNDLFAVQAGASQKLPMPSPTVIYTPAADVIPTARELLGGQCDPEKFFASLAFFARPNMLGFYFANEAAFDAFKTWFDTMCQPLQSAGLTTGDTNQILADFQNVKLNNLTESFALRTDDGDNNEEYSFARIFVAMLMEYTKQVSNAEFGCLPFTLMELYCPRNIVLVNVERHSRASAKMVRDEWEMISNSMNMKINMISTNRLSRLTAVPRALKKIAGTAVTAGAISSGTQRAQRMKFSKTRPKTVDLTRVIKKVIDKMAWVAKSENVYRSTKNTFQKANRRDPDDYNKMGRITKVQYKPDIHLYIDTSGSVSEENYQDAVKACINMAKKLNVNLYFNSFSNVLSSCTKLNCKDKSVKEIYVEFQKVPKVTGGTDYTNVWNYINASKKRKKEISVLMTDFEFWAPSRYIKHPRNLYYIPLSGMDWNCMVRSAESFCDSMMHNDPDIRKHLLF